MPSVILSVTLLPFRGFYALFPISWPGQARRSMCLFTAKMRSSLAQSTSPQVFLNFLLLQKNVNAPSFTALTILQFVCTCFEDPVPKAEITVDILAKHFTVRVKADNVLKILLCYKHQNKECEQLTYFGLVGFIQCFTLYVLVYATLQNEKRKIIVLYLWHRSFIHTHVTTPYSNSAEMKMNIKKGHVKSVLCRHNVSYTTNQN